MFYVLDENHNLIEAYDKEGVLAVLSQAIKDGSLSGITADSAFVSKLKCCVSGQANKVAFVTQAKYNELKASESLLANCLYYITDDTTAEDIDASFENLTALIQQCDEKIEETNKSLKEGLERVELVLLLVADFVNEQGGRTSRSDYTCYTGSREEQEQSSTYYAVFTPPFGDKRHWILTKAEVVSGNGYGTPVQVRIENEADWTIVLYTNTTLDEAKTVTIECTFLCEF